MAGKDGARRRPPTGHQLTTIGAAAPGPGTVEERARNAGEVALLQALATKLGSASRRATAIAEALAGEHGAGAGTLRGVADDLADQAALIIGLIGDLKGES